MFSWDLHWENKTFKLKMSIMLRLRKEMKGSFLKKSSRIFEPLREECDFRNGMSYYCVHDRKEMEENGRTERSSNKKNIIKKYKKHKRNTKV